MEKQVIEFVEPEEKKHSVRYHASKMDDGIRDIYVMKVNLGTPFPKKLKVTLEEE